MNNHSIIHDRNTPLILVTNDDGIESPGLLAAVEAARRLGRVIVAAPTTQQTARGRAMTGNREDHFHPVKLALEETRGPTPEHALDDGPVRGTPRGVPVHPVEAWHIDASPALVVRHALAVLSPDRTPDLVLSGVNYGENLGNNITISGTMGAALQASAQGIPSIAVSRQTDLDLHYRYGDLSWEDATRVTYRWTASTLDGILRGTLPPFDVLKIDIPDPCPEGTEERITRLSRQPYFRSHVQSPTPETPLNAARTYLAVDPTEQDPEDDIYALAVDRVVSVTPIQLDCSAPVEAAQNFFSGIAVSV